MIAVRPLVLLCAVLTLLAAPAGTAPTSGAVRWAPAATAKIHPGVQMFTGNAQCTANFVFLDRYNRVYLGYAAHCAGLGDSNDLNGCTTPSRPLNTVVRLATGRTLLSSGKTVGYGRLAYTSWITMKKRRERNANICNHNDFALVRVNASNVPQVNPSVPLWGGPRALDTDGTRAGSRVVGYGASSLQLTRYLNRKSGTSLGQHARGWAHEILTTSPGVPGDSGAGYMDGAGRAIGTLSSLSLAPLPGTNQLGDLYRELRYAQLYSGIPGLRLVPGTVPFRG